MIVLLTIMHVIICVLLVAAVLLQAGKGGGLASSIGGGLSSSSVLGGRSATTFLTKTTTALATAFLLSCLLQAVVQDGPAALPKTATERMLEEGGSFEVTPFAPPGAREEAETPSVFGGEDEAAGEAAE